MLKIQLLKLNFFLIYGTFLGAMDFNITGKRQRDIATEDIYQIAALQSDLKKQKQDKVNCENGAEISKVSSDLEEESALASLSGLPPEIMVHIMFFINKEMIDSFSLTVESEAINKFLKLLKSSLFYPEISKEMSKKLSFAVLFPLKKELCFKLVSHNPSYVRKILLNISKGLISENSKIISEAFFNAGFRFSLNSHHPNADIDNKIRITALRNGHELIYQKSIIPFWKDCIYRNNKEVVANLLSHCEDTQAKKAYLRKFYVNCELSREVVDIDKSCKDVLGGIVIYDDLEMFMLVLNHILKVHPITKFKITSALTKASQLGKLEFVKALLSSDLDVSCTKDEALSTAAASGHNEIVAEIVLKYPGDINLDLKSAPYNFNILMWAVIKCSSEIVNLLLSHGNKGVINALTDKATLDSYFGVRFNKPKDVLSIAILLDGVDTVQVLLNALYKENLHLKGTSLLSDTYDIAIGKRVNSQIILNKIVDYYAASQNPIEEREMFDFLYALISKGEIDKLTFYLNTRLFDKALTIKGNEPFSCSLIETAQGREFFSIVDLLLNFMEQHTISLRDHSPLVQSLTANTYFHYCECVNQEIMKAIADRLLEYYEKHNYEIYDECGNTLLLYLVKKNFQEVLEFILQKFKFNTQLHKKNTEGLTALSVAIKSKSYAMFKLLLDHMRHEGIVLKEHVSFYISMIDSNEIMNKNRPLESLALEEIETLRIFKDLFEYYQSFDWQIKDEEEKTFPAFLGDVFTAWMPILGQQYALLKQLI